jgi:pimeloyl-ACP methyl ester carboxylesterase
VIEFHKVIGPLVEPVAHGGEARDAFDVIVPSLPGYGFSGKPVRTGWTVTRTAAAWIELMRRLGYRRFVAQGGDWGALVTVALAGLAPAELAGIHLNMCPITLPKLDRPPTDAEQGAIDAARHYVRTQSGYGSQQATRPQTLGYGLADSPAGQAMWIYEKFAEWADCGGDPESVLTRDELLDNIMLYWLPNAGTSSARLYWESFFKRSIPVLDLQPASPHTPENSPVPRATDWSPTCATSCTGARPSAGVTSRRSSSRTSSSTSCGPVSR